MQVVPNAELVQRWCDEEKIAESRRESEVTKKILQDMARIAAQAGLRPYEVPAGILLEVLLCVCVCVCLMCHRRRSLQSKTEG